MTRLQAGTVAAAAALAMLVTAAPASAALACGDTLNDDAKLKADLVCGAGLDGLTIGADNVKLDLNGHTISGPEDVATAGVRALGTNNLKLINGKIRGFGNAVRAGSLSNLTVRSLNVRGAASDSVSLGGVDGALITDNVLRNPGAEDNLDADDDSTEVEIAANRLFGGRLNFDVGNNLRATGNEIVGSGAEGIRVGQADDTLVRGNHIDGAASAGISLYPDAGTTRVDGNTVEDTDQGGIVTSSGAGPAKVTGNTVLDVKFNGFFVFSTAEVILRDNVAKRASGGDGIHVEDDDTLIEDNRVINNDQHGIESFSSNGSGNIARGNGFAQCEPASLCA